MEFYDLIRNRYSARAYESRPVEDDRLRRVLEAAAIAPTAGNRQSFCLIVIHTEGREEELRRVYDRDWFVEAPLVICACAIPKGNWVRRDGKNYSDVDVTIAMDHLILAATDEGLGTCWVGAFDPAAAIDVLGLPNGIEPIAFTPLGYPADQPKEKSRKFLEELVRYETW